MGDSFDDSGGNGNGTINRNECFKINTVLKNDGCLPTGISAVLSTTTPEVVVDQNTSAYPNLAINESGGNLTERPMPPTRLRASSAAPDRLHADRDVGARRHMSFPLRASRRASTPEPFYGNSDLRGRVGHGQGRWRNGISSVCGAPKGLPGPVLDAIARLYDTFSFSNTSQPLECLTVTLDQSGLHGNPARGGVPGYI